MTIRNIPEDVHRAIQTRAKRNGRSAEAEVRKLLETVTAHETRPGLRFGDELAKLGAEFGGVELKTSKGGVPMRVARFS